MKLAFSRKYLLLAAVLLGVEVGIALFVDDSFVRPLVGDVLVVPLVYCAARTFIQAAPWKVALGVFLFACAIEVLQAFNYVAMLGLAGNRAARIILGTTFAPLDFVAYTAGAGLIVAAEVLASSRGRLAS